MKRATWGVKEHWVLFVYSPTAAAAATVAIKCVS